MLRGFCRVKCQQQIQECCLQPTLMEWYPELIGRTILQVTVTPSWISDNFTQVYYKNNGKYQNSALLHYGCTWDICITLRAVLGLAQLFRFFSAQDSNLQIQMVYALPFTICLILAFAITFFIHITTMFAQVALTLREISSLLISVSYKCVFIVQKIKLHILCYIKKRM